MLSPNAEKLLKTRYCWDGEEPRDVINRVASVLSIGDGKFREQLKDLMEEGILWPNSPCIRNAGKKKGMLHACFTLPVEDSIESIFAALRNMSIIFHDGGGVGMNFSDLRPKGAALSGGGQSSGAISFMKIFNAVTETVKQGGFRRGALMGILDFSHPEILMFIRAKLRDTLTNFNLSVMVTNEFMEKAETTAKVDLVHGGKSYGKLKARDILDLICFATWCSGDPGLLFFDRINKDNPLFPETPIKITNPCSEVALPPYGACCLGSVNVAKFVKEDGFDFDGFGDAVGVAARMLLNMNRLSWYPLEMNYLTMRDLDPIGVGIMGFADALIKMGVRYDSEEALEFIRKIAVPYRERTEEIAPGSFYKRIIAPTGSLSILADCSSGIEPIFGRNVERSLSSDLGTLVENREIYESEFAISAHEITPEWHLKIQAEWQQVVDGGISKTINLPESASVDDVKQIFVTAWKMGLKGISVFRNGCKEGVLAIKGGKCDGESCNL